MMIKHLETIEKSKGLGFWEKIEFKERMIGQQDLTELNLDSTGDDLREILQKVFVHAISQEEFEVVKRCMSRNSWDIHSLSEVHSRRPNANLFQLVSCKKELI